MNRARSDARETIAKQQELVIPLLKWFCRNARDLPWRHTRDPYAIWVSEIMLQQTQVKTVVPYWKRWMEELPTIRSLANARIGKLLKLWEGLGYYARAHNLQRAARIIVTKHDGRFPEKFDEILALPGVGRYTAGAICSIARNQPTPILDGNVIRVLTRVFGIHQNPRAKITNGRLWHLSETLIKYAADISLSGAWNFCAKSRGTPRENDRAAIPVVSLAAQDSRRGGSGSVWWGEATDEPPSLRSGAPSPARGDARPTGKNKLTPYRRGGGFCSALNQALMELGAVICTAHQPRCAQCPVRSLCVAYREDLVDDLPNRVSRPATVSQRFAAFVFIRGEKLLVRQRPNGVVNARLWEFPNGEIARSNGDATRLAEKLVGPVRLTRLQPIKHSITRHRITLEVFQSELTSAQQRRIKEGRWRRLSDLDKLPFASAHRKIVELLKEQRSAHRDRSI